MLTREVSFVPLNETQLHFPPNDTSHKQRSSRHGHPYGLNGTSSCTKILLRETLVSLAAVINATRTIKFLHNDQLVQKRHIKNDTFCTYIFISTLNKESQGNAEQKLYFQI